METLPRDRVEMLLRLFSEQSCDHALMFLDPEGRIAWWSEGARRIFGHEPADILGQPASILFSPEDVAAGMPRYEMDVGLRDSPAEDDRWMLRRDGSRFWASGILTGIRDDSGKLLGFGKLLRDRTDVKEQLETLRNLAQELKEGSRRKDAFMATLSHELRNPMGPIGNAVAIIRGVLPAAGPEIDYALKVIERQMSLLERLVEDLLDLTRVGEGKVLLRLAPVVLQDLVKDAVEDSAKLVRQKGHRLEVIVAEAPIVVSGDRDRLHQVLANLLTNAAKYTPEGGRIWVKATTEGEDAVLKVEDNGYGIPSDMLPRIFELFTQVEATRAASQGGLGIGLALVRNLVALHGGTVQVRSDGMGKGSEFAVRIPLARPAGP